MKYKTNVHLLKTSVAVVWGGISMLTAALNSLEELIAIDPHWDFWINLSGSDFPLKTNREIQEYLSTKRGYSLIEAQYFDVLGKHFYSHIEGAYIECGGRKLTFVMTLQIRVVHSVRFTNSDLIGSCH